MPSRPFDIQAHRGGMGLTVENTLAAFERALEIGVGTLEFDIQITRDGYAVVAHDSDPSPAHCLDTGPAFPGDPMYPYVRDDVHIRDLSLAQVRTIDVGSLRHPMFPDQRLAPGARMPLLSEVIELVQDSGAREVALNIETKVVPVPPQRSAPAEVFVDAVLAELHAADMTEQAMIQSFDWASLLLVRELEPRMPISALIDGRHRLQPGPEGASPWLGGLDIDDLPHELRDRYVAAGVSLGAEVLSPVHGEPPFGSPGDPGYVAFVTPELVAAARANGMRMVPWTVDDPQRMRALVEMGVDGLITNRPDVLREVLTSLGMPLPAPVR